MNVETFAEKSYLFYFGFAFLWVTFRRWFNFLRTACILLVFCLYSFSSASLHDILVPAFSTVIIITAAIYLIATHCQPLAAFSTDSPRYQMHNAFPSQKSDLARICSLENTPSWQAPRLCGTQRCVQRHRERWFPFSLRV